MSDVLERARSVRAVGVALGVATAGGAGALAGGWWWVAAATAALAATGAVVDRQLGHAQVLATLALVAGVVTSGHDWYVVVLAAGTIGSIELLAAADRTTVVRPGVADLGRSLRVLPAVAVLAGAVVVVGAVSGEVPVAGAVIAAGAATIGMRVVAR